jgi:hypothetical protein
MTDEERLVARLRELPDSIEPERDLWPEIAARLEPRRPWRRLILQIAAAIAIAGLIAGRAPASQEPTDVAEEIQRKGSEYVAAISALAREANERDRVAGREVALATIYGALFELQRSTGESVPEAMRAVDARREEESRRAERISLVRF